ncbi:MAG: 50S ribosomal protein L9 [Chloroflexi bacterium]|nr:MAG: 50S ribosomal protein L9 [Chloroflexota bacterium]
MWVQIPPALLHPIPPWRQITVKIILTRDVPNLGQAGEVKDVATGYARNYLIPKGLAVKATAGALKEFEQRRAVEARRAERLAARAEALAQRLNSLTLTFEAKASEKGRLFGSITTADIAETLEREVGEKFDRRKHILSEPIRQVGEHTVPVRLAPGVVAEVKVVVKPEGGELPEPTPAEPEEEGSD